MLLVLEPEQHQGQPRPVQLVVDVLPVGQRPDLNLWRRFHEEARLQRRVVQVLGRRPAQAGLLGPLDVVGDRIRSEWVISDRIGAESAPVTSTVVETAAQLVAQDASQPTVINIFGKLGLEAIPDDPPARDGGSPLSGPQ